MPKLKVRAYVAASIRRTPLIEEHLQGQDAFFYRNPDVMPCPPLETLRNLPPHLSQPEKKRTGQFRAFYNHRECARQFLKDGGETGLFFEDDAVPNDKNWVEIVNACIPCNRTYDVFNFYGRNIRDEDPWEFTQCTEYPMRLRVRPLAARIQCHGSLAYFLNRHAASILANHEPWDGVPIDNFIPHIGTFACFTKEIFDHDRQQGSMIDNTKPKRTFIQPTGRIVRPPRVIRIRSPRILRSSFP